MSRRTSESNKAILAAWNREQGHVQEGKGTRDWSPEQQQDILEKVKPTMKMAELSKVSI